MPSRRFSTGAVVYRKFQRQWTNPHSETPSNSSSGNPPTNADLLHFGASTNNTSAVTTLTLSKGPKSGTATVTPGAGNSNSLPGHQSGQSKATGTRLVDQQALNVSDNLNTSGYDAESNASGSHSAALSRKKNLSTSDLDPFERKKQAALVKVEAKLEKAQRLHQKAQQSVEQEISDFLRATTIPNANSEQTSRTANATFDKRIQTLQDTKKELERKITNYQADIVRIRSGDIPHHYALSKDILNNIKTTAAKVAGGSIKHRLVHNADPTITVSTPNASEQTTSAHYPESDDTHHSQSLSTTVSSSAQPILGITASVAAVVATSASGTMNNHQSSALPTQYNNNIHEPSHSAMITTIANEIGNSQFYLEAPYEHIFDNDKSSRKYDTTIQADGPTTHEIDRSPTTKRRLTDESAIDTNDRTSDNSSDDRCTANTSKRNTPTTAIDYQQMSLRLDAMQKLIDRYEARIAEMQKSIDLLLISSDNQRDQNERLNNDLTDLTDLHQSEMSSLKNDLKTLEDRLLYKFNDYWNELIEKLDKLDTRTAKVEQTQTHSLETEENTHRIISKLVNIVLTVFAIILLLLSTIKNLVQSRIHAMTLLILVIVWITFHYLPPNYFQNSFFKSK